MHRGLILDFGGVLTTDFWGALRDYCQREGLPPNALIDLITGDVEARGMLANLERGALGQAEFEAYLAGRLGVDGNGLLHRIAADLRPDEVMLAAVARLRATGVTVGILSNSWGSGALDPYAAWDLPSRADVVVISDQVGMRKPDPEIFELTVSKLGIPAQECVFIDDIAAYLEPARVLGMAVIHHTDSAATVRRLDELFTG